MGEVEGLTGNLHGHDGLVVAEEVEPRRRTLQVLHLGGLCADDGDAGHGVPLSGARPGDRSSRRVGAVRHSATSARHRSPVFLRGAAQERIATPPDTACGLWSSPRRIQTLLDPTLYDR